MSSVFTFNPNCGKLGPRSHLDGNVQNVSEIVSN